MTNFKYVLFLLGVSLLFACDRKEKRTNQYYAVDSLIHAQIEILKSSKATLTKTAEIDGIEETSSYVPIDSAAWANELDIFAELQVINNPVNTNKYIVENSNNDPSSNLLVRSFTGKKTLPVVYLKVFYLDDLSKVRRVEALYKEENSLLKGSRQLILEFQDVHNKTVLTSYFIEGSQKMFLGESVKFSVKGTITLP